MLYFFLEVIGVSLLVSIFATWIKLIPRYPRKKYSLIQQLANTGLLTVVLTLLFSFEIYLSWFFLFAIILLILWLSVRITNNLVRKARESVVKSLRASKEETQSH
jgi:integral membrane sensor domain MASE1